MKDHKFDNSTYVKIPELKRPVPLPLSSNGENITYVPPVAPLLFMIISIVMIFFIGYMIGSRGA